MQNLQLLEEWTVRFANSVSEDMKLLTPAAGIRNFRRAKYSREKFEKDSNSLTHQQLDSQKWAEGGKKRVVKEMITGSLSLPFPFFSRPAPIFARPTLSRFPHYLRAWNRLPQDAPATKANFLRLYKCILSGAIKFVSVRSF